MNARIQIVPQSTFTVTVEPWEFPMECDYEYDPGEAPVMWPTDSAHPGSPPNAILYACRIGGVNVFEMLSNAQRERIEDSILEGMAE